MSNLFKKVAMFSDIHYGLRNNSITHNQDCDDFVDWFIDEAKKRNCETCIFLGDFHHSRSSINVSTLNYSLSCLRKLNKNFNDVYVIIGNHDIYYREKRDIHSLIIGENLNNLHLIDGPFLEGDVAIVPWLIPGEWKQVKEMKAKYMFGHFELPGFKMNALVEMPDHGGLNKFHFTNQEIVFSGHFHKRQISRNVHYIGNPFGHNFADAWDFDRGAAFLEWGKEPEYVNWEDGPKFITTNISDLAEEPEKYLINKAYIKAIVDIELTYEEVNYMKETFHEKYGIRELRLMSHHIDQEISNQQPEMSFKSIDEIVFGELDTIDSELVNKDKLIQIYSDL